jgi:hypothetical protein
MVSPKEVAAWMYQEIVNNGHLSQQWAVSTIATQFGKEFLSPNNTIDTRVLSEFRKMHKGTVIWEHKTFQWRLIP